jgi:hypothetical protein
MNNCLEKILTGKDTQAFHSTLSPQRGERAGVRGEKLVMLYRENLS